jgi:hypothetical protein
MKRYRNVRFLIITLITIIAPLIMGNLLVKKYFWILSLIAILNHNSLLISRKYIYTFFLPVPLILNYISFSMLFGSIFFFNDVVGVIKDLENYKSWEQMHIAAGLYFAVISFFAYGGRFPANSLSFKFPTKSNLPDIILLSPWAIFFIVPLNLDFLGAQGDLSITIKTVLAIYVFWFTQKYENRHLRVLIYFFVILFFATFSIQEKREAIFLVLPCLLLEFRRSLDSFSLKQVRNNLMVAIFLIVLILAMSIGRGYGEYGENLSLFKSLYYVKDYVQSPFFLAAFLQNIEVNYMFFHGFNSIELILKEPDLISYGSTIIKPLFIPLPREFFPWKPKSIIDIYTMIYDPSFRSEGGSWVIPFFSELIWNFGFIAIFASYIFGRVIRRFSIKMLIEITDIGRQDEIVFYLYTYVSLFTFVRGSGLDQFILYLLMAYIVLIYLKFFKLIIRCVE